MARRTPLYEAHRALGGRLVEFAGWEMPLSYRGIAEEHQAVRRHCGLFDVSHMGEIEVSGPSAAAVCQELMVNDVARLGIGDAQYTLLCNDAGGVLDDLIVYRLGAERYLLIVNAASTAQDVVWIASHAAGRAEVVDRSAALALLALQGPEAEVALSTLTAFDLTALRAFTACTTRVAGEEVVVSRTGYTGEDGFEILVEAASPPASARVIPCASRPGCRSAAPTWTPPRRRSRRASRGSSSSTRASSSAARPWRRRRHRD